MLKSLKQFEANGYERNDLKQPVYMDKSKGTPAQVDKTNTIINSAYTEFLNKTTQQTITKIDQWQVTKRANTNVGEYHDNCFENWCHLSFYFNTTSLQAGKSVVVFTLKQGSVLSAITFLGTDSLTAPTDYLNNYGYFTFTYNPDLKEYHISFVPYVDMPSISWAVYLTFSYEPEEA